MFGANFLITTTQLQVSAKSFECATRALFTTEWCRPCSFDVNRNSKSNKVKISVETCFTLFSLFSSNIGYNPRGIYYGFSLAVNDAVNDGTCLLNDFTKAMDSFNYINGYINAIATYIATYVSSTASTNLKNTWNDIFSNMNLLYVDVGKAMNLSSSLAASGSVIGATQPPELQTLISNILVLLNKISDLWTTLEKIVSKLAATIISGKWCQDLCDGTASISNVNASLDLYKQIEDVIEAIVNNYNTYSRDFCTYSFTNFENFFFAIYDNDDYAKKYYIENLQTEYSSGFKEYTDDYNEVAEALTDSDYYSKVELNEIGAFVGSSLVKSSADVNILLCFI